MNSAIAVIPPTNDQQPTASTSSTMVSVFIDLISGYGYVAAMKSKASFDVLKYGEFHANMKSSNVAFEVVRTSIAKPYSDS